MMIILLTVEILFIMQQNGVLGPLLPFVSLSQIIIPTSKLHIEKKAKLSEQMILFLLDVSLWDS